MDLFRYKIDRLPISIITSLFLFDLFLFFSIQNKFMIVSWFLSSFWIKMNICPWNHHHQHCPTFYQKPLNLMLDFIFGFLTGVTSKGWLLHHNLGHHQTYLDQTKDEAGWKTKDGRTMGQLRYALEVSGSRYYRTILVGLKFPKHLKHFLAMFVFQFSILGMFFTMNWFNALFLFLIPMMSGLFITSWANHSQHADLDTQNEYEASRNIVDPTFNLLTGNLGYHTAHHLNQGLHWSKLADYHQGIEHLVPATCYVDAGFPYTTITKLRNKLLVRKQTLAWPKVSTWGIVKHI